MNTRSLIVFSFLSLVGLIWFVFLRDDSVEIEPTDPLSLVDFDSGVQSLTCFNEEHGTSWTIATGGQEVMLTSEAIGDGKPVRANKPLLRRILSFLRDERPLSHHDASAIDLNEWGLEPPTLKVTLTEESRTTEIHIGRPDINDEVGYRESGGDTVFRVKEHLIAALRHTPEHYRDPRLLDANLAAIQSISYHPDTEQPFAVRRLGARWMVGSGSSARRGDQQLCDSWTNAMSDLKGVPVNTQPELDANNNVGGTLTFKVSGSEQDFKVEILGVTQAGKIVARRENDSDLRVLEAQFTRYFQQRPEDLADRILVGFSEGDLRSITLSAGDGALPIRLVNPRGRRWFIEDQAQKKNRVDADTMQRFLERLLKMPTTTHRLAETDFKPAITVRFGFDENDGAPPLKVTFSATNDDGSRWARRSDESGDVLVSRESLKLLQTPWWEFLDRAVALGDDSRIDWLRLTDQTGKVYEVLRTDGVFRIDGNSVAIELLQQTLARCAYLVASGFTGPPSSQSTAALQTPLWRIEWRHEGPKREALRPSGTEVYEWRIGARINDADYECTISSLPGTLFLMSGRDFNMLKDTAAGIERARSPK